MEQPLFRFQLGGKLSFLLGYDLRTVSELAKATKLTDNAVPAHLATLERDGLLGRSGGERGFRKPHYSYELTARGGRSFPEILWPV